ncbi:hypothetical protein [Ornithinimicrobium avium]|uniref:Uncharacterized protein n=1 Tax=Ornithinimicrobium avium TaxID=2283195 RepID=A0A345NLY8_9MICO|nr:hypothetical protein [Ornithinimicrobium avium]AXH96046.1 hypothetical protein DV701_07820 [Ornithinimicrobium avium]
MPYRGSGETAAGHGMADLSDQLREIACDLAPERTFEGGRWCAMDGCRVTVVRRDGRDVSTADEHRFFPAWRCSGHLTVALHGDVFAVTPHGWTGTIEEWYGLLPSLAPSA